MIAVAFTVSCQRQGYLRSTLDSWARVRGIGQARLLFALEPGGNFSVSQFSDYLDRTFPGRASVHLTDQHLGCLRNTRRAACLALEAGDGFGVVAEEDIQVADDVLEYFEWAREEYREDKEIQAVCAHARATRLTDPAAVARAPWFNPLVWGTWQDRWDSLLDVEWGPEEAAVNPESWDRKIMSVLSARRLCSLFPVRSRSVHCGEISTMHFYDLAKQFWPSSISECFARHYDPAAFHEIAFPPERGELVV